MSDHEGKFSKFSALKHGHGEDDSRLDDSRVVNVDSDEHRDLEMSLEMEQIQEDEDEEEKIDSDKDDLEHKGGPRSPGRRPLQAPKSVLPKEDIHTADDKQLEDVKKQDISGLKESTPVVKTEPKKELPIGAEKSSNVAVIEAAKEPERQPTSQPAKSGELDKNDKPTVPSESTAAASNQKSPDKPVETTGKETTKPDVLIAAPPAKEKKESSSWNPFKKKTPKPAAEPVTATVSGVATPTGSVSTSDTPISATAPGIVTALSSDAPAQSTAATNAPVSKAEQKDPSTVPALATQAAQTAQPSETSKGPIAKEASQPVSTDEFNNDKTLTGKTHVDEPSTLDGNSKRTDSAAAAPTVSAPVGKETAAATTAEPLNQKQPPTVEDSTVHTETDKSDIAPQGTVDAPTNTITAHEPTFTTDTSTNHTSTTASNTTVQDAKKSTHTPSAESKPTNLAKSPSTHAEESKNAHISEPPSRSFKFKRNRQAAEVTGNQGGQNVTVLPKHEVSLRLQAAWRGKQARRKLRKQQFAAIAIQAIYRGNKERERSSVQMKRHREKIQAEQTRKSRLAHIRSKEKDLMLLASIPPDQYLDFERLRRENGAKAIQRNYRALLQYRNEARQTAAEGNLDDWLADDVLLGTRAHTSTLDARRYPAAFTGKTGKAALSGHSARSGKNSRYGSSGIGGASTSLLGSTAHSEEKLLKEQSDKLRAHMVSAMSEGLAEQKRQELFAHFQEQKDGKSDAKIVPGTEQKGTPSTPLHTSQYKPYEREIEALALAQLQRKVKEAAHNRVRQADARAAKSGFRSGSGYGTGYGAGYRGASGDVNLSYDANTGIAGTGTGTGGAPRWGARRNYQDLMEAQTQANILLEEHLYALPHITERQRARHKTLGNVQHLLQQLQTPLSLDQAKQFIQQQKRKAAGEKGNAEHKDQKDEPFDTHAAAWLLDEELWADNKAPSTYTTSNTTSNNIQANKDNLFVNPTVVQAAAEQHIHALHALRTSGITHTTSNNANTTTIGHTPTTASASATKKHWGAVALPLPLHIVTNPNNLTNTDYANTDGTTLRGSGEWKDLRNSFNRSFDADTANNTAANATTTANVPTTSSTAKTSSKNGAYSNTTPSSLSQRLLTDAKLFRPLATQWAAGSDVEDSLYWIAYATQPSNIQQHAVDPSPLVMPGTEKNEESTTAASSAAPTASQTAMAERTAKEYEELRRRIAVEAMCLSQRVPRVRKQVQHEQERINRLAEVYQGEMFAYLRKEHALSAAQLLGGERAQQQHRAASRVQALARGRRARVYVAGLRAQQRVYMALQNLFHEIALSEGVPPPPLPSTHNNRTSYSKQQAQQQAHQQGRTQMFNHLLSNLAPAMHAHSTNAHSQGNTHVHPIHSVNKHSNSAPSTASTRTGGSTLAGLNISNNSSGANLTHRPMNSTHLSALTATPYSADRNSTSTSTPSQYPLQAVIPPANKQFTAHREHTNTANNNNAYTDPRALVSNITHKHVNIHGQTPSYFSPMVQGTQHSPSRGIDAHYKDFTTSKNIAESKSTYGESKHTESKHAEHKYSEGISNNNSASVGIAGTPGGVYCGSVVSRGAWSGGAPQDAKKNSAGGSHIDPRTGSTLLGQSSPSKHTFNLLTASYSAGQQVPEESLLLSQSFTGSEMNSAAGTPHSPERYGTYTGKGNHSGRQSTLTSNKNTAPTGPFSPKATVSFSIEVPADHSIPTGRQLQRSIDTPVLSSPTRPATTTSTNSKHPHTVDTPGSAASHLSEFSYVHDDDLHPHTAYISSPGGTHRSDNSLSRSLSASFGQVSGNLRDELYEEKDREDGKNDKDVRTNSVMAPFSPDPRSQQGPRGGLSPGLLARYGTNNPTSSHTLHSHSSDDSVEGLEIPYHKQSPHSTGSGLRSFRVHGSVQASKIAARATVAVQQAMAAVEGRFRSNTCTVQGFVGSAMAADVRNFDKAAALRLLQSMAMVTGVSPLIHWLQRFRYDPQQAKLNDPDYVPPASSAVGVSPSTSLVMTVGEIAVQDCALLIAELTAELQLMDTSTSTVNRQQQSDSEREKEMMYNLIQTCVLLKLLGAAADSGRLHISELHALLEDSWVLAVPMSGTQVSLLLAQLRFALLQHATRKAHHPRKSFDALLTHSKVPLVTRPASVLPGANASQEEDEDYLSTSSVATLFSCIFTTSTHFNSIGANTTLCVELAQAAVRLIGWKDSAEEASVLELRNFLCSLCSFRSLQKRIQVWFRAVPGMHQTLLKEVAALLNQQPQSNGMVTSAAFCQACDASGLPLSHAECFMLSQLLTRRKPNTAGVSAEGGVSQAFVDVAQLQRIKVGDFLQAAL